MKAKSLDELIAVWLDAARGVMVLRKLAREGEESCDLSALELQVEFWFGLNRN